MTKQYQVQPPTEIELQFPDRVLKLRFNAAAAFHIGELEGGLSALMKKSPTELCTMIVYLGACENEPGFSLEDAKAVVAMLDVNIITGLINDFMESLGVNTEAELSEMQKKTMLEFLEQMQK